MAHIFIIFIFFYIIILCSHIHELDAPPPPLPQHANQENDYENSLYATTYYSIQISPYIHFYCMCENETQHFRRATNNATIHSVCSLSLLKFFGARHFPKTPYIILLYMWRLYSSHSCGQCCSTIAIHEGWRSAVEF